MAANMKLWMLVPHHDFPANGPLALGSILADPSEPGNSLNEGAIVKIPRRSIYEVHKYNYHTSIDSVSNRGVGLLARYLNVVSWGKLSASFDSKNTTDFYFEDLETTYFCPKPSYIQQSVSTHDVHEYLEGANFAPVYMIIGLKISRGRDARVINWSSYRRGGEGKVGFAANIAGHSIGIDAGEVMLNQSVQENTSFGGSSDFVIGYRLGKISFLENQDGYHVSKLTSYTVGAMWSADDEGKGEAADALPEITARVQFDGEDVVVEALCHENLSLAIDEEDDQVCKCFIVPEGEAESS